MPSISTKDILEKYSRKLESEIAPTETQISQENFSQEYIKFKQEMIPELSRYERWAKSLGNIIKIKVAEKDRQKVLGYLQTAHLDVTPEEAITLSIISMLGIFLLTLLSSVSLFLITNNQSSPILFGFLGILTSLF